MSVFITVKTVKVTSLVKSVTSLWVLLFCSRHFITWFFNLFILRVIWFVEQTFMVRWTNSLQSFVTLFISLLFHCSKFLKYFIENRSFKNLLTNIVSIILFLCFLVLFKFYLKSKCVVTEYLVIARQYHSQDLCNSFSYFLFHNFGKNLYYRQMFLQLLIV